MNVSHLSLACSSESIVLLFIYILIITVLSCQQSKTRTEQSECDASRLFRP